MNTDYLAGYIDALKALSARIDAIMADALAKAKADAENPALDSYSFGERIALLAVGERIARATGDICKEAMAS